VRINIIVSHAIQTNFLTEIWIVLVKKVFTILTLEYVHFVRKNVVNVLHIINVPNVKMSLKTYLKIVKVVFLDII
jgi:hypothetical protein